MNVVWLNYGVPRSVAISHGQSAACVQGSWIDTLANAIARVNAEFKLCVFCIANMEFDVQVNGIRYVSIGGAVHGLKKGGSIRAGAENRIADKIRELSPDVIHIQGTEHIGGALDSSVYGSVPVVVSIQGVISQCYQAYTGGISHRELLAADKNARRYLKRSTIFDEQEWWRVERAAIEQKIFKRFKYFIGRTEWDRQCLAYYNPKAKYYIGNESLNEAFANAKWERSRVRAHSIYCGNALGYGLKGGHWLIRAVAELRSEFPDIQLRIAAAHARLPHRVSLGQWVRMDTYSKYVRNLIKELDCSDAIVALPPLSPQSVSEELTAAEVFVLPSVCENSPNTLCEAMRVGVPSIATFTGGIPSIMRHEVEGRLVPTCDPHALAGEIRKYFLDHAYAERYVEAARRRAIERHDPVANAHALLQTYRDIVKDARS